MYYKKFNKASPIFYLIFRVVVGLMFAVHGAQKFGLVGEGSIAAFAGFAGVPIWLAVIAGLIELVGGILVAVGFFSRISALFGVLQMIVAQITVHLPQGANPFTNGGELSI